VQPAVQNTKNGQHSGYTEPGKAAENPSCHTQERREGKRKKGRSVYTIQKTGGGGKIVKKSLEKPQGE